MSMMSQRAAPRSHSPLLTSARAILLGDHLARARAPSITLASLRRMRGERDDNIDDDCFGPGLAFTGIEERYDHYRA